MFTIRLNRAKYDHHFLVVSARHKHFWLNYCLIIAIGDDQNKVKRPLLQGFANTSVHCISVSVLRGFALVAFGDLKISINYKWSGAGVQAGK